MALAPNTSVPPFPLTAGFTADASTQPLQEVVIKLALAPGSYQLGVLPDLMALTTANGAPTPVDYTEFLPEALVSYAYVLRTVNWYEASGLLHTGDDMWSTLRTVQDTLAIDAVRAAGFVDVAGDPSFLS